VKGFVDLEEAIKVFVALGLLWDLHYPAEHCCRLQAHNFLLVGLVMREDSATIRP